MIIVDTADMSFENGVDAITTALMAEWNNLQNG